MRELTQAQAFDIKGGFAISGTLINGFYRTINALLDLGRSLGTAFRMYKEGKMCSL